MVKKIVYSGLILIIIGLIGSIATFAVKNPFQTIHLHENKTISISDVNKIEVKSSSTDVMVIPSKQKDITVKLSGKLSKNLKDHFELNVDKKDGTVEIAIKRKNYFNISLMAISQTKLIIGLPENMYQSISVKTSSGDILTRGLHAEHLGVKSSSGDIRIEKGTVDNKMTIETSSGDINTNMQDSKLASFSSSSGDIMLESIAGIVDVNSSSGDIEIHPNDKIKKISVETSSGDVQVQTPQKELPFNINFKGNSGSGTVQLKDVRYSVKSENVIVGKISTGTIKLKVRTSSGDFKMK
ncbi:DUF4097 family beta strand repeat-containing protein [Bacillus sp. FJAT-49736]|uniref:DUF4097 family beta strand repeat-containing protein n=1 Tax=Bacillus sp. FJAT-49736 TaxID=2833582 RepID=UPI001BCA5DBC|nr:DUF4097 family beta strand repeat-containing protein [Bacillus sp. FJAT-49736]MBS4174980.1 DUF4097 family beta strand repeat protein [Bacillus sp. FJAT-49736]